MQGLSHRALHVRAQMDHEVPVPDAGEMVQDMSFTISQEAKDEIYQL